MKKKNWFSPELIDFFIELAPNNNKDWFDKNRSRYEEFVKEPFKAFVAEMIKRIQKVDPSIQVEPKDVIFRINRDIRFSKDKYPYKLHVSAAISSEGKKHRNSSGFYFELSPEALRIYQGAYFVESAALKDLREYMAENLTTWQKLKKAKAFAESYGGDILFDERASRLPKELAVAAEKEEDILNKNFYWGAEFDPEVILDPQLPDILMDYFKAGKPLCDFLDRGLGVRSK